MPSLYHKRDSCRLCGGKNLALVLKLTKTPLANAFVSAEELGKVQPLYPLNLYSCQYCQHVQLLDVINPKLLFSDYVYKSGTSPDFVRHFQNYANEISARYPIAKNGLVVDIGSNDGTLLSQFKKLGMTVLGVDPANNIAQEANRNGIETRVSYFDHIVASEILTTRGPASAITANNVFAHVDDLVEITQGVRSLLAPDGVFVFEVSYLADVIEKTLFDTIYHEHLSYHSVEPLEPFFEAHGMEMIGAYRVMTHGGSLRVCCQLKGGPHAIDGNVVKDLITRERKLGLNRVTTYKKFASDIDTIKNKLYSLLTRLKSEGKSIAAYGAPAKATTLMYHFRIGPEIIDYIVDDSPLKQSLYSPGFHIPVVASDVIYKEPPDYLVVLAWNFVDSIIKNHSRYQESGGQFIVPLPTLKIV